MAAEKSGISLLPPDFHWKPVDFGDGPPKDAPPPPLAVLENFRNKKFAGTGFNTIFRPNNVFSTATSPSLVNPPPPQPSTAAVLELNLTTETLYFSDQLGNVPNRGFQNQGDINLNGISYLQHVKDVTNTGTGKADGEPTDIHAETGFWMNVPASNVNPVVGNTLLRMASIPHGTTINAQGGPAVPQGEPNAPSIGKRDITPFQLQGGQRIPKHIESQIATNSDTPRLPKDLTLFMKEGTITQAILSDPATVLNNVNAQLTITNTLTFNVTTSNSTPFSPPPVPFVTEGGGTANSAFLVGATSDTPNANAIEMDATFWVETVTSTITIPVSTPNTKLPLPLQPAFKPLDGSPPPPLPTFLVTPPQTVTQPIVMNVKYTQIQYAQIVYLQFAGLVWPHASVATLVLAEPIVIDAAAFATAE